MATAAHSRGCNVMRLTALSNAGAVLPCEHPHEDKELQAELLLVPALGYDRARKLPWS